MKAKREQKQPKIGSRNYVKQVLLEQLVAASALSAELGFGRLNAPKLPLPEGKKITDILSEAHIAPLNIPSTPYAKKALFAFYNNVVYYLQGVAVDEDNALIGISAGQQIQALVDPATGKAAKAAAQIGTNNVVGSLEGDLSAYRVALLQQNMLDAFLADANTNPLQFMHETGETRASGAFGIAGKIKAGLQSGAAGGWQALKSAQAILNARVAKFQQSVLSADEVEALEDPREDLTLKPLQDYLKAVTKDLEARRIALKTELEAARAGGSLEADAKASYAERLSALEDALAGYNTTCDERLAEDQVSLQEINTIANDRRVLLLPTDKPNEFTALKMTDVEHVVAQRAQTIASFRTTVMTEQEHCKAIAELINGSPVELKQKELDALTSEYEQKLKGVDDELARLQAERDASKASLDDCATSVARLKAEQPTDEQSAHLARLEGYLFRLNSDNAEMCFNEFEMDKDLFFVDVDFSDADQKEYADEQYKQEHGLRTYTERLFAWYYENDEEQRLNYDYRANLLKRVKDKRSALCKDVDFDKVWRLSDAEARQRYFQDALDACELKIDEQTKARQACVDTYSPRIATLEAELFNLTEAKAQQQQAELVQGATAARLKDASAVETKAGSDEQTGFASGRRQSDYQAPAVEILLNQVLLPLVVVLSWAVHVLKVVADQCEQKAQPLEALPGNVKKGLKIRKQLGGNPSLYALHSMRPGSAKKPGKRQNDSTTASGATQVDVAATVNDNAVAYSAPIGDGQSCRAEVDPVRVVPSVPLEVRT